jgi:hypothetical protein
MEGDMGKSAAPAARGVPGKFLEYDKYVARFARDVGALQRLWLVPLALSAFWLAIENSYETFRAIPQADRDYKNSERQLRRQAATVKRYQAKAEARALAGTGGASSAGKDRRAAAVPLSAAEIERKARAAEAAARAINARLLQEQRELEALQGERDRRVAQITKLRGEAVNLTVAGTVMPSRLSYAPTLWLVALLAWLIYFAALKQRAQKNLAAAVAAYPYKRTPFGLSEESSLWLAPIPDTFELRLPAGDERASVRRPDMLRFLGWTDGEEQRIRMVAALIWAALLVLVIRIVLVSAEVNSGFAVENGITGPVASYLNSIATAVAALLCGLFLARLSFARGRREYPGIVPPRRDLLAFAGGGAALLLFIWNKPALHRALLGRPQGESHGDMGRLTGNPRYVAERNKQRRRQRRVAAKIAEPGDVLVKAVTDGPRAPTRLLFTGVSGDGRARFAASRGGFASPGWRRIWPRAFAVTVHNARGADDQRIADARQTAPLEAAALALIGRDRLIEACDVLLGACRISIETERPNLRLFELLAGLAARYHRAAAYRPRLEYLILRTAAGSRRNSESRGLRASLRRWQNPRWERRWRRPKTIFWGHPLERVTEASWRFWEREPKSRARLVALEPEA